MLKTAREDASYDRNRDLPRLLMLWPDEVRTLTMRDQPRLIDRLARALRAERQRGHARHWSYDLSRHAALLRAYRAEKQAWEEHLLQSARRRLPAGAG